MTLEFRALFDIIETADCHASLARSLSYFASTNGFKHHAYLCLDGSGARYFGNYPQAWNRLYFDNQLFNIDPVIRHARQASGSFSWSMAEYSHRSSPSVLAFARCAINHGIGQGVTISARASFDSQLLFSLARVGKTSSPKSPVKINDGLPTLMGLHYRLKEFDVAQPPSMKELLSPRERLCLIWAAKGKTAPETAIIIKLSARTVQHYLDSARQKLGAATVAQLVSLSKDLKII